MGADLSRWRRWSATCVASLVAVGAACSSASEQALPPEPVSEVGAAALAALDLPVATDAEHGGALVADWMDLHADIVQLETLSPPVASRLFAYLGVALHEALAIAGLAESLAPALDGLEPRPADERLDAEVVAVTAVAELTREFVPGIESTRATRSLEQQHLEAHAEDDLTASQAAGRAIAQDVLEWSRADGYAEADRPYDRPEGPGSWVPTAPGFAKALEPYWRELRPFLVAPSDCPVPPPVPYSEDPDSAFWAEAMAVVDATPDPGDHDALTAKYWNDRPGATSTPPGHWIELAAALIHQHELDLVDAARAYAVLGVTSADAFIGNWYVKYRDNVVRPVTYIRALIDPAWRPHIQTPPFPEYPSGHSTVSAALSVVMTDRFGSDPFVDDTRADLGYEPREYESFAAAAEEAAWSRLAGGIHYPMGIEAGIDQGRCIGSAALAATAPND